jgi:hypothetical protein
VTARRFCLQPGSPQEEIAFLIDFVNGDWDVFLSDSMTEVFYHVHRSPEGGPLTPDAVAALREEARAYLRDIAQRRRPQVAARTIVHDDYGAVIREGDFISRVRQAAMCLYRSRRAIRECVICDDFFLSQKKGLFCLRHRDSIVARAWRLEQAREWTRRSRERASVRREAKRARLQKLRDQLLSEIERRPTRLDRGRLSRVEDCLERLARESHAPPPPRPPIATWEITVSVGLKDPAAPEVWLGPLSPTSWTTAALPRPEPVVSVTSSGTYQEVLDRYRAERRKACRSGV